MGECVKCGRKEIAGAEACVDCGWPFTLAAWRNSPLPIRRVTFDTGCINAKRQDPDLNTLERWAGEGLLIIEKTPAMLAELKGEARRRKAEQLSKPPLLFTLGLSILDGDDVLAGPDIGEDLRDVLFPTTAMLTSNQAADVEHLRSHVRTGADAFVTLNPTDYIRGGKQESLKQSGVWVFTPAELVALLKSLYGWS